MNKRPAGRGITLLGRIRSKFENRPFNAVMAMNGERYPTMWQKVKAVRSVGQAKGIQKKLGER